MSTVIEERGKLLENIRLIEQRYSKNANQEKILASLVLEQLHSSLLRLRDMARKLRESDEFACLEATNQLLICMLENKDTKELCEQLKYYEAIKEYFETNARDLASNSAVYKDTAVCMALFGGIIVYSLLLMIIMGSAFAPVAAPVIAVSGLLLLTVGLGLYLYDITNNQDQMMGTNLVNSFESSLKMIQ